WELIFKAYLLKNCPEIKVIQDDRTTKPFDKCLENVKSSLGKSFFPTAENVSKIYEYRCNSIHFYQEDLDVLLYSLSAKSVEFYSDFILNHFSIDLADETNLILLPIGFKKPISPIIFLSNQFAAENTSESVKQFIQSIIKSTDILIENEIEEAILVEYNMSLINENRIKNADLKAAITQDKSQIQGVLTIKTILPDKLQISNDESAKKISIDEEALFDKIYTETLDNVCKTCEKMFRDFSVNKKFRDILQNIKNNPQFHRIRLLDKSKPNGLGKSAFAISSYYTKAIYEAMSKYYAKKDSGLES
ncbi:MAG: DUF3644 domain-containing protein, partial [Pseudomonadota bacterium]